jgi:hypothetical protein
MTLLFATRTDSRFATGSLYPDYVYELTFPRQMLARPEVPSWQQYNFAGSMTMVFASGSARALFDEDPTPCAPSVKGVDRRGVHRSFFDYAPIGKQELFSEHPVCPVTVGTIIADRPPYRSVRAELPHTAPTSDE